MNIIDNICDTLGIEKIRAQISPIDNIKLVQDIISDKSIIKQTVTQNYNNKLYRNDEYKFIFDTLLNFNYEKSVCLLHNHYTNMYLDIYFIIGNIYFFNASCDQPVPKWPLTSVPPAWAYWSKRLMAAAAEPP